ncbi:hypothetical protein LCGC14_0542330 [marine sediment metagenome]|uniref:Uncharacterized protein n=1 Tax=marine sediment metagenome TaxID=412755 RepID=A0A0F9V0L3_9ZZZZ
MISEIIEALRDFNAATEWENGEALTIIGMVLFYALWLGGSFPRMGKAWMELKERRDART